MTKPNDKLAAELSSLSPALYQVIRSAYYQAAEGLTCLTASLEEADAAVNKEAGELLDAHLKMTEALAAFEEATKDFGRIL